ncbi:16584_t:CDS:2, partial [Cetraspora pellucida]
TVKNFGKPVCQKCGTVYENTTEVSTLRRHLKNHQIEAPKKKQTTLHIYWSDPHNKQEQKKRNEKLIFWLIVDQQSFTMVENQYFCINISEAISCVLREFELSNKTIALTTDNESAMITCGHLLAKELENEFDNIGFSHYRCVAHVLNLVAKQGLRMVDLAFKGIRYLKAELDMEVRWNSTFYILQKFKNIELALNLLSVDNNLIAELYPNNNDQQNY